MSAWQPIETLPLDGRVVLLAVISSDQRPESRIAMGHWLAPADVADFVDEGETFEGGIVAFDQNELNCPDQLSAYSHWMELPVAPSLNSTLGADVQTDGVRTDPIPARYTPASWRDTTPIDPVSGTFGLGFTTPTGDLFLRLDLESGRNIAETYAEEIQVHSARSSGASRSDVRSPDAKLKCEPTKASEAAERAL